MKTRIVLSLASWALLGWGAAQAQEIVVNPSVKIAEISKSDLRDIFTGGSSNYKDGSRAVPVSLKSGAVHEAFLKEYVGKNDVAFRSGWHILVFAGQATLPKAFDSEEALIHYVNSVPGAIGYIGPSTDRDKVKALVVK